MFALHNLFLQGYCILLVSYFAGIVVTNDGNAILRELDIAHPAAKVCGMFVLSLSLACGLCG